MMTLTQINLFILALLGHFVGDYVAQNTWMATNKSKWQSADRWWKSWLTPLSIVGHKACTIHVFLYTAIMMWMMGFFYTQHLGLFLVIALPHWLIDRFSLAAIFMEWKNRVHPWDVLKANEIHPSPAQIWQVSFTSFVYVVTDNTIHVLCLYLTVLYLL